MKPTSYIDPLSPSSPAFCHAFAKGCGGEALEAVDLEPGPVAMFPSPRLWPLLQQAQIEKRTYYYGDKGYFGREKKYFRITKNARQHDGSGQAAPRRFEEFEMPIKPWRRAGEHILICPQSPKWFELHGLDPVGWRIDVALRLSKVTDRPLRWRMKSDTFVRPIAVDLAGAWAIVTHSSNSAVEAILAGVPAFCLSDCAGSSMGLSDLAKIESPVMPAGREQWAWNLAANQWTLEEISSGIAWKALN